VTLRTFSNRRDGLRNKRNTPMQRTIMLWASIIGGKPTSKASHNPSWEQPQGHKTERLLLPVTMIALG
jgi:hypothetical protein